MNDRLDQLSTALDGAEILHSVDHNCIHIPLTEGFGTLELKLWQDGSDSIQLIPGDFHTHLEILALEYKQERNTAFATLADKIFKSELLLVEETSRDGVSRKTIEASLEDYLRYLPEGSTYRVFNKKG